ncbi:hypothetical protein FDH38_gp027 [Dinoroseobacter phage vB_DshS-R5C]|uniref:Uncharacterized protein n=1 Tax=Dinoroseobacter phage vB_DshS-R5C TaxID=1965368 RepID=A0A1V0DY50_9CAUD|nr:hypothetical protein FDH38_gp027 [Dinoroseobacter phage vB_DshS-R5C]ARB06081.1 hypothetical protein vBDshSR5C_27 [Dinoroseobacter phage vB_DshS-R5C]
MSIWPTSRRARQRAADLKRYEAEDRKLLKQRALRIKAIANRHLNAAQLTSRPVPVKEHVVVPYEDLLRMWDIADHIATDA